MRRCLFNILDVVRRVWKLRVGEMDIDVELMLCKETAQTAIYDANKIVHTVRNVVSISHRNVILCICGVSYTGKEANMKWMSRLFHNIKWHGKLSKCWMRHERFFLEKRRRERYPVFATFHSTLPKAANEYTADNEIVVCHSLVVVVVCKCVTFSDIHFFFSEAFGCWALPKDG